MWGIGSGVHRRRPQREGLCGIVACMEPLAGLGHEPKLKAGVACSRSTARACHARSVSTGGPSGPRGGAGRTVAVVKQSSTEATHAVKAAMAPVATAIACDAGTV